MGIGLTGTIEPRTGEIGRPWEGGISAWMPTPKCAEVDDPFDDFDEDVALFDAAHRRLLESASQA